jgi:hypothetical protein
VKACRRAVVAENEPFGRIVLLTESAPHAPGANDLAALRVGRVDQGDHRLAVLKTPAEFEGRSRLPRQSHRPPQRGDRQRLLLSDPWMTELRSSGCYDYGDRSNRLAARNGSISAHLFRPR